MNNPAAMPSSSPAVRRVCIVQQVLPHYRVPVFDLLGRQPGVQLTVCCSPGSMGSLDSVPGTENFTVRHSPLSRVGPFIRQPVLHEAASGSPIDVLICSWNRRILGIGGALKAARRRGVRTILWGHGFSKNESSWRRYLRNTLARRADALLLYNHTAARKLIDEGFDPSCVFVAQNSIDQAPIQAARDHWLSRPADLEAFRAKNGLVGRDASVFISRLEPDKKIELLLNAWVHVVKQRPTARLIVIGKGASLEDSEALARSLGIEKAVVFTGPIYDDMDIAPWCLCASSFAYPAAIGLSIFHGFGYGLPVVTSDDIPSHNPEIEAMRNGENGLLYRDGDPADFAAKLLQCMTDEPLRERLSREALSTVLSPDGFNIQRMVQGFMAAIARPTSSIPL
jgi:glycosyltransferase involved in cell wall biosynthesis